MTKKTTLKTLRQRCSDFIVKNFTSSQGFSTCSKVTKIRVGHITYACRERLPICSLYYRKIQNIINGKQKIYRSKKKEVINRIILVNSTGRVYIYNMTSAYFSVTFQVTLRACSFIHRYPSAVYFTFVDTLVNQ